MPSLYKYLYDITREIQKRSGTHDGPTWLVGDATFDTIGELMSKNLGCLYDELSTFLTQLNLYRAKGLAVSHELAHFLQLYNGISWSRQRGMHTCTYVVVTASLVVL